MYYLPIHCKNKIGMDIVDTSMVDFSLVLQLFLPSSADVYSYRFTLTRMCSHLFFVDCTLIFRLFAHQIVAGTAGPASGHVTATHFELGMRQDGTR